MSPDYPRSIRQDSSHKLHHWAKWTMFSSLDPDWWAQVCIPVILGDSNSKDSSPKVSPNLVLPLENSSQSHCRMFHRSSWIKHRIEFKPVWLNWKKRSEVRLFQEFSRILSEMIFLQLTLAVPRKWPEESHSTLKWIQFRIRICWWLKPSLNSWNRSNNFSKLSSKFPNKSD